MFAFVYFLLQHLIIYQSFNHYYCSIHCRWWFMGSDYLLLREAFCGTSHDWMWRVLHMGSSLLR